MGKKVKVASHTPWLFPDAAVNLDSLKACLRMIETGCDYLDSLLTDDNVFLQDPLTVTICSYRDNALDRFAEIREFLNSGAVTLNPKHPAFAEMCKAAGRVAEEARCQHIKSSDSDRPNTEAAPKLRPARSPVLLTPTRPGEAPAS